VGYRDRYYAEYKLVVELDGKQAHPGERRGADEDRDNHAAAAGGSTLRFGWADATRKACESAAITANALRERGWQGELKPRSPGCRAVAAQTVARAS
jgi:very-short-patch-repair endonuclease